MSRGWFVYIGAESGQQNAINYVYVTQVPPCTTTGEHICAILGIYDPSTYGNYPAPFSNNLETYIITALANNISYPTCPE